MLTNYNINRTSPITVITILPINFLLTELF